MLRCVPREKAHSCSSVIKCVNLIIVHFMMNTYRFNDPTLLCRAHNASDIITSSEQILHGASYNCHVVSDCFSVSDSGSSQGLSQPSTQTTQYLRADTPNNATPVSSKSFCYHSSSKRWQ